MERPLIVIVGSTASGKTGVSIRIAKKLGGEIVSADSRAIYKGMDIATAKPSMQERDGIPHWGIDIVGQGELFSASDFKDYAVRHIEQIRSRGHVPMLVGGSGLYVDSVLFDYRFGPKSSAAARQVFNDMTLEQLWKYCENNNITMPENINNKRYVVRAIEQYGVNNSRRLTPSPNTIVVGITTKKDVLEHRIEQRVDKMLHDGLIEETKKMQQTYPRDSEPMKSNAYRVVAQYLDGSIDSKALRERLVVSDMHLAKKQHTWFQRNKFIHWLDLEEIEDYIYGVVTMEK